MKRISAFAVALLLAATGSVFAASSRDDSAATTHHGTMTMHRLGADLRSAYHKIGRATRNAWHHADDAMHRHRNTRDSNA